MSTHFIAMCISFQMNEAVQRHFLSKIQSLNNMDYWEKLRKSKIYSQEGHREHYMVIFLWKISQGLVNGYDVQFTSPSRHGRTAIPHEILMSAPALVRNAREASLGVKGARLFNLRPLELRKLNCQNVKTFKKNLDDFLSNVPDQPTIPGLGRTTETNSLLHQIPLALLNH